MKLYDLMVNFYMYIFNLLNKDLVSSKNFYPDKITIFLFVLGLFSAIFILIKINQALNEELCFIIAVLLTMWVCIGIIVLILILVIFLTYALVRYIMLFSLIISLLTILRKYKLNILEFMSKMSGGK